MSDETAKTGLKFILGFFIYGLTLAVALAALAFLWGANQFQKPGPLNETTLFTVERGQGANAIATKLYAEGLIEDPFIFMIGTTILGNHTFLKAGEYEIVAKTSAYEIMNQLKEGKTLARRFTIREGLTSFETIRLLKTVENLSGEITTTPSEGTLLPNTYDYQLGETRAQIIARLQNKMETLLLTSCQILLEREAGAKIEDFLSEKCTPAPEPIKTVKDVLTLASIVEKETAVAGERGKVAAVFLNRLKKGMPLQTDPTVIYAITKGKHKNDGKGPLGRRLLRKDLQIDDPYNTYKYPGLPPGPIANPGRASIEAVLNPEKHDYIYFVADGTGGHAFAKTLKEHNANVAKWRKIRREKKN